MSKSPLIPLRWRGEGAAYPNDDISAWLEMVDNLSWLYHEEAMRSTKCLVGWIPAKAGCLIASGARRREDGSPPGRDVALASGSVHDSRPEGRALQFFQAFLRDTRHQNKYF